MSEFAWKSEYLVPVVVLLTAGLGFVLYFFTSFSSRYRAALKKKYDQQKAEIIYVLSEKLSGVIFLGILPAVAIAIILKVNILEMGITTINHTISPLWYIGVSILITSVNFLFKPNAHHQKMYPQMRIPEWSARPLILDGIGWLFYLLAYEFMFRGFVLFLLVPVLGVWPAIMVSTVMYALAHVPYQMPEAVGAFPFGVFMCMITLYTGNIWLAYVIHVSLAVSNNVSGVFHHPDMKFKSGKTV